MREETFAKEETTPLDLFSHSCVTASLGPKIDPLNYNWNFAYAKDFPSRMKTSTWAN